MARRIAKITPPKEGKAVQLTRTTTFNAEITPDQLKEIIKQKMKEDYDLTEHDMQSLVIRFDVSGGDGYECEFDGVNASFSSIEDLPITKQGDPP